MTGGCFFFFFWHLGIPIRPRCARTNSSSRVHSSAALSRVGPRQHRRSRDNLMKLITAKAKGAHITLEAEPERRDANVVNLMGAAAPNEGRTSGKGRQGHGRRRRWETRD